MDIFDLDGTKKDEAWLAEQYDGCHVQLGPAKEGLVFRIAAIYVTEGPALFKGEVRNEEGSAQNGQPVAFSYPSLTDPNHELPDISKCGAPKIWTVRAVTQKVSGDGTTGFGLGSTYGPFYQAWVVSPSAGSDCVVGAGMKGGTDHRGPLHVVWQLVYEGAPTGNLPWDEPKANVAILADKVRWWTEESYRQREAHNFRRANDIHVALIDRERGLMYRMENALKKLSPAVLAKTEG